jgi:hypothetical protein
MNPSSLAPRIIRTGLVSFSGAASDETVSNGLKLNAVTGNTINRIIRILFLIVFLL